LRGTSKPMATASEPAQCFAQLAIRHAAKIVFKDVVTLAFREHVCQCSRPTMCPHDPFCNAMTQHSAVRPQNAGDQRFSLTTASATHTHRCPDAAQLCHCTWSAPSSKPLDGLKTCMSICTAVAIVSNPALGKHPRDSSSQRRQLGAVMPSTMHLKEP
jgi:hypothetical protein